MIEPAIKGSIDGGSITQQYPWDDPLNGINALVPDVDKSVKYAGIDDVARIALKLREEGP